MDDPIQTNAMIRQIIEERRKDVVGLAVTEGGRLKLSRGRNKFVYLVSLLVIMGTIPFIKNGIITLRFKLFKYLSRYGLAKNPSIAQWAKDHGIETFQLKTPNSKGFLKKLEGLSPDLIINQSQSILKDGLLSIPTIGTINRHNALLPKNRGRLTPFWVLYNNEKETGVSIHFVERSIDSGDIIVQKKILIDAKENFNSLVEKNYQVAGPALLEAIDILERGDLTNIIRNDNAQASYNTTPTLKQAIKFRTNRLFSQGFVLDKE